MQRLSLVILIVFITWPAGLFSNEGSPVPAPKVSVKSQNKEYRDSLSTVYSTSKIITIYDNAQIPASMGISKGSYTKIDGYRYVNITVEYEQKDADEAPLSLGVMFAYDENGKLGSRRCFSFDQNSALPADPQMITVSGKNCWHGYPANKSSYISRFPVMGPYLQVFPFNNHTKARKFSVVLYLTK